MRYRKSSVASLKTRRFCIFKMSRTFHWRHFLVRLGHLVDKRRRRKWRACVEVFRQCRQSVRVVLWHFGFMKSEWLLPRLLIFIPDVIASPSSASCCCHGSGITTYIAVDLSIYWESKTASCVLSSSLLARLESWRKSMESFEVPRTEIALSKNQRRVETVNPKETACNVQKCETTTRIYFRCCGADFNAISHSTNFIPSPSPEMEKETVQSSSLFPTGTITVLSNFV